MGNRKAHLSYCCVVGLALIGSTAIASAASLPTTTTLSPSPLTAFASAPNNIVVLTANVTAGATGTVTFKDGATALTCTGGNPAALTNGSATCSTSFSTEGIHVLSASYSGDSAFIGSTGTANVFIQNHATNLNTRYCNSGAISANGNSNLAYSSTSPYPSVIFVGDGVNTDLTALVDTVSVEVDRLSSSNTTDLHMLLVSPDGTHAFDFWSDAGSSVSNSTFVLVDSAGVRLPQTGSLFSGSYGPTAYGPPPDPFTSGPPSPAPQLPATFATAPVAGTSTFASALLNAPSHGAWSLYVWDGAGTPATIAGGWCLNITPGTATVTTTTVATDPKSFAALNQPVTFTATISSTPAVGSVGTVAFTENGLPLIGAPHNGFAGVIGNQATITTSSLPEGDHTITAAYHDALNPSFTDSFGTVAVRIDKQTNPPTQVGNTWSYCNTGPIAIPAGVTTLNNIGPGTPNPSNIFVKNFPGTIASVSLTLKGFHVQSPLNLESLLVGPNGSSAPTAEQTLDFFSLTGGASAFGPQDTLFSDTGSVVSPSAPPNTTNNAPTSRGSTSYTASQFYPLPSSIQHATTAGSFTFNSGSLSPSGGGVYLGTDPNGTWSLYFNQLEHGTGSGLDGGWCLNITQNMPSVSVAKSHSGTFTQGEQNVPFTINITNNGPGSTGDPTNGNNPLIVTDTLNSAFAYAGFSGTGWSCSAVAQTVKCQNASTVAQGASYAPLAINVNVSTTASTTTTISNLVQVSGGGVAPTTSNTDTVTISSSSPVLAVQKTHTGNFTQGQTAQWNITVSNTSTGGSTFGSITMSDTLPAGFTLASYISTATAWSCSGTNTVTCTTTAGISGGANSIISLTVNVPANSPSSVSNTAGVFGGGDLTHTNLGNAATATDTATVVQAKPSATVVSYSVQFGAQQFNLIGSTRIRLPWDITGIQVVFSQPIAAGNINSLAGIAASALSGLGTNTLIWTVNPIPIGSFSTTLLASGPNALKDANGNPLNGGTNFTQNFKVLWGDFNDDGVVSASDSVLVNNARSSSYNIFADVNGNGVVDATDVSIVRTRIGTSQP